MTKPQFKPYLLMQSNDDDTGYWKDGLGWVAMYFAQLEWCSHFVIAQLGRRTFGASDVGPG